MAGDRAADLAPVIEELREAGAVSFAALARGLNARGRTTARGGAWSPMQVSRLLGRLQEAA
jgi:hypothetical protein